MEMFQRLHQLRFANVLEELGVSGQPTWPFSYVRSRLGTESVYEKDWIEYGTRLTTVTTYVIRIIDKRYAEFDIYVKTKSIGGSNIMYTLRETQQVFNLRGENSGHHRIGYKGPMYMSRRLSTERAQTILDSLK